MRRRIMAFTALVAGMFLLAWLFCLPADMFRGVPYSTVVTASGGELLGARVANDGQWRFPPSDSIPAKFAKALVEYEDRTFYSHCGISLRGVGRALWQNMANGCIVSGASTITMQTIRMHRRAVAKKIWTPWKVWVPRRDGRTMGDKLVEAFMATRLELRHSKQEILRLYASNAPFGGNVVGIGAASWRYLGSDGSDMSWAEAATLAVLPNAPSAIHLSRNRDKLLAKRNRLLRRLYDKGELTQEEYELALDEPLIGRVHPLPQTASHLVDFLNAAAHGRHTVTAIDCALQKRVEQIAAHWRAELSLSGINDLAVVVADVSTGEVVAYCGNADIAVEREGRCVDIARAPRSSGSILKPLLYCAAIQDGIILDGTLLPDIPTDFGGFVPKNYDASYSGVVSARTALARSLNIPNVWLLREYGVSRFATLLKGCGLSTFDKPAEHYGLSLVLGGAEVSLLDVVRCYTRMVRHESGFPLNDSVAIYSMLNAMREVNRPDQLDWSRVSSVQNVAWKTGTSYGARDAWAIGITPGHVVGVWAGNADGSGVADLTGARTAGPVMFDVFNAFPPSGWFGVPKGVGVELEVCRHSGHVAGKCCQETELRTVSAKAVDSRPCPYCVCIPVSMDGQRRVTDMSEPVQMKSYFVLPPMHKHYYKQGNVGYVEPPVAQDGGAGRMKFRYPLHGAVISLPRKMDGTDGMLVCKAVHSVPTAELFWHLDGNFIASTTDIHQIQIAPSAGFHRLTIVDGAGMDESIEIVMTPSAH